MSQSLLDKIETLLNELELEKQASMLNTGPDAPVGGLGGGVAPNTTGAPTDLARSREHSEDIRKYLGSLSPDSAKANVDRDTAMTPWGLDKWTADDNVRAETHRPMKEYLGSGQSEGIFGTHDTYSPKKVAEVLHDIQSAFDVMNEVLADIATGAYLTQMHPVKVAMNFNPQQTETQVYNTQNVNQNSYYQNDYHLNTNLSEAIDNDLINQLGNLIAQQGPEQAELVKSAATEIVAKILHEAEEDADLVGQYLSSFQKNALAEALVNAAGDSALSNTATEEEVPPEVLQRLLSMLLNRSGAEGDTGIEQTEVPSEPEEPVTGETPEAEETEEETSEEEEEEPEEEEETGEKRSRMRCGHKNKKVKKASVGASPLIKQANQLLSTCLRYGIPLENVVLSMNELKNSNPFAGHLYKVAIAAKQQLKNGKFKYYEPKLGSKEAIEQELMAAYLRELCQ
ncbi:MAG: hypothetical protein QXH92_04190 [Candidatus Aenigmatarchaeota archaeon]